jgi:hypothetical protein
MALPACPAIGGSAGDSGGGFGMDTAGDLGGLVGMAGFALDRRQVIGVRIVVNIFVAVAALEAAVNARVKLIGVDADGLAVGVLHGGVAVAGETIDIRVERARGQGEDKH